MLEGEPIEVPEFSWDPETRRHSHEGYQREMEWVKKNIGWDNIIRFPRGDGYAFYAVEGDTLRLIIWGDAWEVEPALIRGLTREEVDQMMEREKRLREISSRG